MFEVREIVDGNPGLGRKLRSFRSYPEAKRYSEKMGWKLCYGVAIVDTIRGIVDYGDDVFADAKDCRIVLDEVPFYARRYFEDRSPLARISRILRS